jgi:quinol monooxygenase YgiN
MKNSLKILTSVFLVMVVFACNYNTETAKVEPVFEPFQVIFVQHPVADFDVWKDGYMAHDSMRMAYGISNYVMGRGIDDPNWVFVINKIEDAQKAKDFTALPDLKNAMDNAGVTGSPTFSFIDVIRNDDSEIEQKDRVMIVHSVKDFDTWLKAYDKEGMEKRAENGLLDRGLGRSIDDPNIVYVVFAITDMDKAKARIQSEELKNLMMDAGVEGPPTIQYYTLVN